MTRLLTIDEFDNFHDVRDVPPNSITTTVIGAVRDLDEREELEPYLSSILLMQINA